MGALAFSDPTLKPHTVTPADRGGTWTPIELPAVHLGKYTGHSIAEDFLEREGKGRLVGNPGLAPCSGPKSAVTHFLIWGTLVCGSGPQFPIYRMGIITIVIGTSPLVQWVRPTLPMQGPGFHPWCGN